MLSGTRRGPDELCGPLTGVHHWTAGCHGTNWFFIHLLRAVNIPAEYIRWSGHATPHFPSEAMYLSHGDDPYNGLGLYSPPFPEPFPTSEILIPESKYTQWFNASNSSAENLNNVGRQMTELGVKYLPQVLLGIRCQDIANGVSNADSQVYRPGTAGIGRHWTVAELEAMNFWERMDAKIAQYGGCPIPPPVRPARDEPIDLGRYGDSDMPMAILHDPRTGQVRGFLRDLPSTMQAAMEAAGQAAGSGLEVLFSRGIPDATAWRR